MPPVWGGLTAKGVTPPVTQAQTEHLPNKPFAIDDPNGFNTPLGVVTHDLWHRFYQNQMQIDGGKNDKFVAYADSGALVMGHYDGSKLPLWKIAKQYTLADNFFMGAFGGSFLNHIWLVCACTPIYPDADNSPAKGLIAVVEPDGVTLKLADNSPKSAMDGVPKFVNDGRSHAGLLRRQHDAAAVPAEREQAGRRRRPAFADPAKPTTLPPQHEVDHRRSAEPQGRELGLVLRAPGRRRSTARTATPVPNFQFHHQPFNYFASFAPGTDARAEHLKDGGMNGAEFIKAIDAGKLPQVTFYKPQGNLNEHAGYADVDGRRRAHRRRHRASGEEPAMGAHARRRHL